MTLATLPAWAQALIADARVAHLALLDADAHPRVLPITYAVTDEVVWSAIDRKPKRTAEPARVRWLRQRPDAAVVIDHYDDDWRQLAWVQLLGQVTVLDAGEASEGLEALTRKYAHYRSEPPPGPVLCIGIERALHWRAAPTER